MKISRLFHWLYAILMMLPFAFFVPSILYYAFNDNSTMQTVEVPKIETIPVDFNQKVQNGDFVDNEYWTYFNCTPYFQDGFVEIIMTGSSFNFYQGILKEENHQYLISYDIKASINLGGFTLNWGGVVQSYSLTTNYVTKNVIVSNLGGNNNLNFNVYGTGVVGEAVFLSNVQMFDLTQMFGSGDEPTIAEFNQIFSNAYYPYTESELMQITYDTGETEQLVSNTDIINYAWESIWDLPLFSWTKVTFVSVPFSYLTGIFGIGVSNSLNYVFGYFVTISIVWLVFDLLLYVPMLAHNWIDKARIE